MLGWTSWLSHKIFILAFRSSNLLPSTKKCCISQVGKASLSQGEDSLVRAQHGSPICGRLVKRLRHRPFTAVSGVRFPHRSPRNYRLPFGSLIFLYIAEIFFTYFKLMLDKFSLNWYDNSRSRDVTIAARIPGG